MRNIQISPETPAGAVLTKYFQRQVSYGNSTVLVLTYYENDTSRSSAAKSLNLFINSALGDGFFKELKDVIADPAGVQFKQPDIKSTVQDPKYTNKET